MRAGRDDGIDVHAVSHVTGGGLAANLARVLPRGLEAVVDRVDLDAGRRSSAWSAGSAQVPVDDLERTLNLGVGMVAVVVAGQRGRRGGAPAGARGLPAWVLGTVGAPAHAGDGDVTQGAKGVDGGAVRMVGSQPL